VVKLLLEQGQAMAARAAALLLATTLCRQPPATPPRLVSALPPHGTTTTSTHPTLEARAAPTCMSMDMLPPRAPSAKKRVMPTASCGEGG